MTEEAVIRALVVLVQRNVPASTLDRILYFYAAQSDRLLFDVVVNVLVAQQAQGLTDVDAEDIRQTLAKWAREGKTTSEWGDYTIRRVSQGVLATLRDFGVPDNSVVFLTRVAAMSPGIFHMSMLLDKMHGKNSSTANTNGPRSVSSCGRRGWYNDMERRIEHGDRHHSRSTS